MKIVLAKDYEELSKLAANKLANVIKSRKDARLGLATGSTPLGMYKRLVDMYKGGEISFKDVVTFNLDEYQGLYRDNPKSYFYYMQENLFKYIDIDKKNINIPDGMCADCSKECMDYESKINKSGGIDFLVLGLGNNGHIGFNEPSDSFIEKTHRIKLHDETVKVNSRFFSDIGSVPRYAITMGIKSILNSKSIMLLANGRVKAEAIKKAVNGPITPRVPASVLKQHKDLTIILDEEAASLL